MKNFKKIYSMGQINGVNLSQGLGLSLGLTSTTTTANVNIKESTNKNKKTQTVTQPQTTQTSTQSTSNLSKNDILQNLYNCKIDFTIHKLSEITLDNTKPNIRQDILEGVAFYSQQSISREWEILRTPWYQNNIQFKQKIRKLSKNIYSHI